MTYWQMHFKDEHDSSEQRRAAS